MSFPRRHTRFSNYYAGHSGFSLIELIIVIVILSVIAAISSKTIEAGFNAYFTNQNITSADASARLALARMARDIHLMNRVSTATSSQLAFTDVNGNSFTYQLSGNNLILNDNILMTGVGALTLSYRNSNAAIAATLSSIRYVTINLTVNQNNVNYAMRTTVYAMNME